MKDEVKERTLKAAHHIAETGDTVRKASEILGIKRATLHKDLVENLPQIDIDLYAKVQEKLEKNKAERSERGGEAYAKKMEERFKDYNESTR